MFWNSWDTCGISHGKITTIKVFRHSSRDVHEKQLLLRGHFIYVRAITSLNRKLLIYPRYPVCGTCAWLYLYVPAQTFVERSQWPTAITILTAFGGLILTLTLPGPSAGVSESLDSYCSLKPLCSGMGEAVPARTSPTLLPPSPRTVLSLSYFKVLKCINCRDWHCKS